LHPSCSLQRVADVLPFTYTGADLYALCSDAMLKAITRAATKVDQKVAAYNAHLEPGQSAITIAQFFDHHATEHDVLVTVTEEDFVAAHRELVPSVSAEELGHYERVRKAFEGNDAGPTGAQQGLEQTRLKITQGQPQPRNSRNGIPERPSAASQARSSGSNNTLKSSTGHNPGVKRQASTASNKSTLSPSTRSTFYFDQATDRGSADDDDDYVIRTENLRNSTNGFAAGEVFGFRHEGHGKVKGKGAFGSATNGDEDLYQ
jgi:peroxin-6